MTILVTGSRGAVARNLIDLLRQRGLTVRAASSRPETPDVVRCDLTDPSTFGAVLTGVTSVFLYAQPSHTDAFVEEAISAGIEHVVLLSSAAVLNPDAENSPLAKSHLDVEKALTASSIRNAGQPTTSRPRSAAPSPGRARTPADQQRRDRGRAGAGPRQAVNIKDPCELVLEAATGHERGLVLNGTVVLNGMTTMSW